MGLGIGYGVSTGLCYGLSFGPSAGLHIGVSYACVTFPISLIVEKYREGISLTERLRWTWSGFFQGLRSFKHCVISGTLALGILLMVWLSYGLTVGLGFQLSTGLGFRLRYGLSDGLSSGLSAGPGTAPAYGLMMGLIVGVGIGLGYWLGLGLFQSVAQEQIEDQDRQHFNQGVRRYALNSTIIGLLSGGIIGGLGFLGYWLSYALNVGLSQGLSYGLDVGLSKGVGDALRVVWLFAIGGGLFGWAVSGGWAVLRHCVLRWLLHRRQVFPWHAQGFLNDATARILVRRVGVGTVSSIASCWSISPISMMGMLLEGGSIWPLRNNGTKKHDKKMKQLEKRIEEQGIQVRKPPPLLKRTLCFPRSTPLQSRSR